MFSTLSADVTENSFNLKKEKQQTQQTKKKAPVKQFLHSNKKKSF